MIELSKGAQSTWKNWYEHGDIEVGSISDLKELLPRAHKAFGDLLDLKISFEDQTPDSDEYIFFDQQSFEAMYGKILKNAKSAQASKLLIVLRQERDNVFLRISDDGVGVSQEKLLELNSDSKREEGQGHYIKNLMDKMAGTVCWESIEGIGSSCELVFHLCGKEEAERVTGQKEALEVARQLDSEDILVGKNLMIVDDSRVALRIFEQLFQEAGAKVELFTDPKKALTYLEEHKPDCLIVDYEMPVMSGVQLVSELRSNKVYSELPILMLTGREDDQTIVDCLNAGVDDYLFKTANVQVILTKIKSALRQKQFREELISLRQVSAMKSVVVTLNHEFNNIVSILLGRTGEFKKVLNESQQEHVQVFESSLLRLIKLIKKVREIEKFSQSDYAQNVSMIELNTKEKPKKAG